MIADTQKQVQHVRRRLVQPQVQLLRRGRWLGMAPDVLADCVVAANGDAVVAHRLMTRWEQENHSHTMDITPEEETQLIDYVRQRVLDGFECDCGTCGTVTRGERIRHKP